MTLTRRSVHVSRRRIIQDRAITIDDMAIRIVTIQEADAMEKLVGKYNELFERVDGTAPVPYVCDNTGVTIPKGSKCSAVLLLPNKNHHNYEHQHSILRDYVIAD